MSYVRRGKKISHDGVLNVFDLDDDIEELSIAVESDVHGKGSERGSINSGAMSNKKDRMVDPLANRKFVDPLSKRTAMNVFTQDGHRQETPTVSECSKVTTVNNEVNVNGTSKAKQNDTQNSQAARSTASTRNSEQSSEKSLPKTQSTQRNTTFSSNTVNRSRVTPRVNRNQKGFGREENDMIIDDIDEF